MGRSSGCDIAEVHRTSTQLGLPVSPWSGQGLMRPLPEDLPGSEKATRRKSHISEDDSSRLLGEEDSILGYGGGG